MRAKRVYSWALAVLVAMLASHGVVSDCDESSTSMREYTAKQSRVAAGITSVNYTANTADSVEEGSSDVAASNSDGIASSITFPAATTVTPTIAPSKYISVGRVQRFSLGYDAIDHCEELPIIVTSSAPNSVVQAAPRRLAVTVKRLRSSSDGGPEEEDEASIAHPGSDLRRSSRSPALSAARKKWRTSTLCTRAAAPLRLVRVRFGLPNLPVPG
ncbi:hypothetical protein GQ600_15101 [Phytophthora cactorum]|nr:hypothetical protein GQ600_15101 [Phytophthora cactorum]